MSNNSDTNKKRKRHVEYGFICVGGVKLLKKKFTITGSDEVIIPQLFDELTKFDIHTFGQYDIDDIAEDIPYNKLINMDALSRTVPDYSGEAQQQVARTAANLIKLIVRTAADAAHTRYGTTKYRPETVRVSAASIKIASPSLQIMSRRRESEVKVGGRLMKRRRKTPETTTTSETVTASA